MAARETEETSEVRTVRHLLGLHQSELARELGVSRQTVNLWESGRAPTPRVVRLALRLLLLLRFGEILSLPDQDVRGFTR